MKACELFTGDDFEELIITAEGQANGDWEMTFMADMVERFGQYGDEMFISPKQLAILGRIAKMDVPVPAMELQAPAPKKASKPRHRRYQGWKDPKLPGTVSRKPPPKMAPGPEPDDSLDDCPF